jgi:SAM-dependent methyltransferase
VTDADSSLEHLLRHHGDFEEFRDLMRDTSAGRFGPIWWGIWEQYLADRPLDAVMDLGTGPGLLLPMIRRRLPDAAIVGVEVQPAMLQSARQQAEACGASILEANLSDPIDWPSASVDLITAVMVLHELQYPPVAVAEIARILRPGGTVILYDWVKQPLRDYTGTEPFTVGLIQHFREHCLFSGDDWAFMLERAGLSVKEVIGRRGQRYAIVVAEKPLET